MRNILLSILSVLALSASAENEAPASVATTSTESAVNYVPKINGVLRARWEDDLNASASRFQLRNARVSLTGNIAPTIDYFLQVDLCDQGTMKFLDGYARIKVIKGLSFQAGQFRMPFGIDMFRAPHNYIFSNRSFIGNQMCNVRAVGAKATYVIPHTPLTVEGGIFNPATITDHTGWHKSYAYAGRVIAGLPAGFSCQAGVMSIIPETVRINMIDAGITWTDSHWTIEAEYLNKHYTHNAHRATHGYNFWADYRLPVKAGMFNQLSFQGRFDGMTDHSTGKLNADGYLTTDHPGRNRLTLGATLSFIRKPVWLDIRVDYENYFYRHDIVPATGKGDRIVAELVLRF